LLFTLLASPHHDRPHRFLPLNANEPRKECVTDPVCHLQRSRGHGRRRAAARRNWNCSLTRTSKPQPTNHSTTSTHSQQRDPRMSLLVVIQSSSGRHHARVAVMKYCFHGLRIQVLLSPSFTRFLFDYIWPHKSNRLEVRRFILSESICASNVQRDIHWRDMYHGRELLLLDENCQWKTTLECI